MKAIAAKAQTITNSEYSSDDVIDAFLKSLDVCEKTRETYARALKQYFTFLEGLNLDVLGATRQTILDYKQALIDANKKPATNLRK